MSARHTAEGWNQYQSPSDSMSQTGSTGDYTARMDVDDYPSVGYPSSSRYAPSYFDNENFSDDLSLSDPESNMDSTASTVETPSIELDKNSSLLHLKENPLPVRLFDLTNQPTGISLSAQLNGKFCLGTNPGNLGTGPTIICYRRNLFSVMGNIKMPTDLRYILYNNREYRQIMSTTLLVTAKETLEGNRVKLIKVPYKSSQTMIPPSKSKVDQEPIEALALTSYQTAHAAEKFVALPLEWKRLQFRASTLNNGRRRELQQHFILSLTVVATLEDGERISIFEANSEQIVVRGRSPRNFQPKNGNANSRRSRASTGELPLTLTKTKSGSNGSFRPAALPMPPMNYGVSHDMVTSGYPLQGIVATASPDFGEHYTMQRSSPLPVGVYQNGDDDSFSRRPRSSTYHSPRTSPYPAPAFSSYGEQSSLYEYAPTLPTSWAEYGQDMYPAPMTPPVPMPSAEARSRTPRVKRHHSGNRC